MIKGIGTDIIEISRIQNSVSLHGQKFLDKIFTSEEQAYCNRFHESSRPYAGRFAAKEAIVKALGTGFREGITWLDLEILPDAHGKPKVYLSRSLIERFENPQILLSISHCKEYATATALWQ
jgi:holo-[acyl-carrier protein] synthase